MIGNGHGIHVKIGDALEQRIDPDGTVQKTVLGVDMKVYEPGCCLGHFMRLCGFGLLYPQPFWVFEINGYWLIEIPNHKSQTKNRRFLWNLRFEICL
jgi:hypothetical protein